MGSKRLIVFGGALRGIHMSHVYSRNAYAPHYLFTIAMSIFKMVPCYMLILRNTICHFFVISSMSHVDFKKKPCHNVASGGQEPLWYTFLFIM